MEAHCKGVKIGLSELEKILGEDRMVRQRRCFAPGLGILPLSPWKWDH